MKILLIAYKIEPDKGSEDGTGYHLTKALLAKEKDITLLTRTNNIEHIKTDHTFAAIDIIGVDVPKWLGFFKKKERGIIAFYYLWQIFTGLKVRQLQKTQKFDVIHQLNFHATWAPHFLFSKTARIVWGPLTHHQQVPERFCFGDTFRAYFRECVKIAVKRTFWVFDPFLYWAARRTHKILYSAQNIVRPYSTVPEKLVPMTYAGSPFKSPVDRNASGCGKFNILFVGRFTDLKGAMTSLYAVRELAKRVDVESRRKISMTLVGDGELYTDIAALAQIVTSATGVDIEIFGWQKQEYLTNYYQSAAVFLYPSFEGQGLVVAEAVSQGCPVLCLQGTGPQDVAEAAGIAVPYGGQSAGEVIDRLADELHKLFEEYFLHPEAYMKRIEASFARAKELQWSKTADKIIEAYHA